MVSLGVFFITRESVESYTSIDDGQAAAAAAAAEERTFR
jgi:hypothetical protein